MGSYSQFIHADRRAVKTPKDLVDASGRCVFGTFDREFETMELLRAKKPTHAPEAANRLKLTLWEATEVHLKQGVLLAVVCDMGIFGKTFHIFYDKRTRRVYTWDTNLKSKDTAIAPNLTGGSRAKAETACSRVNYENHFERGACSLSGCHKGKDGALKYQFSLSRISRPSVVSIPFGPNRPLYSQKDFFKAEGKLVLNGEELRCDGDSVAVVDDHRGYYPRRAHYDWVTTMGRTKVDGRDQFFAFNLTRNQSIDQERYNENLIWLEERTSLLPPVTFARSPETKDFKGQAQWRVRDQHDMVNLRFHVYGISPMVVHALVVNIDYYVAFGVLEGYVRDEDGNKYVLDGMMGMGEDKTLLL